MISKTIVASLIIFSSLLGINSNVNADFFSDFKKDMKGLSKGLRKVVKNTSKEVRNTATTKITASNRNSRGQSKLNQDQQRTKVEGLLVGVAGGALLGNLLGDSKKSTGYGAMAGGLVGLLAGNKIAAIKKSNVLAQDKLNQQIAILDASILNTRQHNKNTGKLIQLTRIRISHLGRNRQKKLALFKEVSTVINQKKNVIRQQRVALRQHQNLIILAVRQAQQKKEHINSSRNNSKTTQLKRELKYLENSVIQLSNLRNQMMARG